jgi:hypothetical protein
MEQFYSLRKIAVMLSATFLSYSAISQTTSPCGQVVQDFNSTGGGMAGFTSSTPHSTEPGFTYGQTGQNGYLQRCNIPSPQNTYEIVSPTFQTATTQTFVGYGFNLSGAVAVSSITASILFVDNTNHVTLVTDTTFTPTYTGTGNNTVATICDSFLLSRAAGFTPGESYQLVFTIVSASASNNNQCIVFDNFRTTGGPAAAPLPVTFMGFGAKQTSKGIELIWNVTAERDVQSYIVERSSTGADFGRLGEVAAKNSTAYSFMDNQPVAGMTFYRIKEVDIDGKSKYSPVVRLNLERNIALRAYPSPATTEVTVEHSATDKGTVSITTADGRIVKQVEVKPQMTQTFINTSTLKAGLYVVRFVAADGTTQTTKLIKQ